MTIYTRALRNIVLQINQTINTSIVKIKKNYFQLNYE